MWMPRRRPIATEAEKVAKQKAANEKAAAEMEQQVKSGIDAGLSAARSALVADARKKAEEDVAVERRADAERVSELEASSRVKQTELKLLKRERELNEKARVAGARCGPPRQEETDGIPRCGEKAGGTRSIS